MPRNVWGRRPSVLHGVLLAALLVSGAPAHGDENTEFEKAARTILCDCGCHPQSVYDCACGRAEVMREEIAARIRSGETGEGVISDYVARFGEKIRIAPTARGFNLVAWLGPGVVLLLGAFGVLMVLRRWRRHAPASTGPAASPPAPDDPYLKRLEREIRDLR